MPDPSNNSSTDSTAANPAPINPAATILGAPALDSSQVPLANRQQVADPSQPLGPPTIGSDAPLANRPQVADPSQPQNPMDKHSLLGRAVRHIATTLEGSQINYVADPQTGDVKEVVEPRKAGGFFRDLLLSAVLGGAAGAQLPPGSGGLAGLGAGAEAAMRLSERERQIRQARANEQGTEIQRKNQADIAAGMVAVNNSSTLQLGAHVDLLSPAEISRKNNSSDVVRQSLLDKVGGQPAQIVIGGKDVNGQMGNGPALMRFYNKNPEIMNAADGFHRVMTVRYDTSGLEFVPGKGYVDSKTGQVADMNDRTAVYLTDVPASSWNKSLVLSNQSINDVAGITLAKGNPTSTSQVTVGSLLGLHIRNKKDISDSLRELHAGPKSDQEADEMQAKVTDIQNRMESDPDSVTDDEKRFLTAKAGIDGNSGPLAAYNAARQKREAAKNAAKGTPPPKTLPEASVALTRAKFADSQGSTPDTQKAVKQAQADYDGVVGAKRDELAAEYNTQLKLARGKADAERAAKEQYDKNVYGLLTSGDQTGWTPKPNQFMTESQFNSAKQSFANGQLSKAQDVDKSYAMFQSAYGEYRAANGKLPTGAQSMLALSTHLSTTFGNVKGSRVTKDMIQEHLGARSISDSALVAVQKLTSGDVLSPQQWKAFNDLITQSRNQTWKNAVDNAHYRGLPADFLPDDLSGAAPTQPSAPQNRQVTPNNRPPNAAPPRQQQQQQSAQPQLTGKASKYGVAPLGQ